MDFNSKHPADGAIRAESLDVLLDLRESGQPRVSPAIGCAVWSTEVIGPDGAAIGGAAPVFHALLDDIATYELRLVRSYNQADSAHTISRATVALDSQLPGRERQ